MEFESEGFRSKEIELAARISSEIPLFGHRRLAGSRRKWAPLVEV